MPERIASRANPLVRRVRALSSDPDARRDEGAFVAEGIRIIEEALAASSAFDVVLLSPRLGLSERGRRLRNALEARLVRVVETTDAVLDAVSNAETSQGVLSVIRRGRDLSPFEAPPQNPFWVVAWGLQVPGNVGALLRTADAAGADLFLCVAGTADATSPKAVRASAGSIFRLPVLQSLAPEEILDAASRLGIRLMGTDPARGVPYDEPEYRGGIGFVFGREGEGLPPALVSRLHRTVTIPMRQGVESLNVAAAAAVVLFEAARRRRGGSLADAPAP
jgi:TrmH family RNA methyltransferase